MGLKVGPVSANESKVRVAPVEGGDFDIVYGFAGLASISEASAQIIVDEREANGDFTSPEDLIKRCFKAGLDKKNVYENLAYAGAFDEMGKTRKSIIEAIPKILNGAKTSNTKGTSLFDLMGGAESASVSIKYTDEEFDYGDRLRLEANTIGIYVSGHPMDYLTGGDLAKIGAVTLEDMMNYRGRTKQFRVVAVPTKIDVRTKRGKSIFLTLEDKTITVDSRVDKSIVKAIDKGVAREKFKELYRKGNIELEDLYKTATDGAVGEPREGILENRLYVFEVLFRPSWDETSPPSITVLDFQELKLTADGRMPVRIRFRDNPIGSGIQRLDRKAISQALKEVELKLRKRGKNETSKSYDVDIPILISRYRGGGLTREIENIAAYRKAMELSLIDGGSDEGAEATKKVKAKTVATKKKGELFGGIAQEVKSKGPKVAAKDLRQWPPLGTEATVTEEIRESDREAFARALNELRYVDSGRKSSKILNLVRQVLAGYGVESSDVDSGFVVLED